VERSDGTVPAFPREHIRDAVMRELQGFLDAVNAYEAAITGHFGLERSDLPWLTLLAQAENGMSAADVLSVSGLPASRLEQKLDALWAGGHAELGSRDTGWVTLNASARKRFAETYARIETAYVGLHRYGAEELGVVRTFLRTGRHFYERQTERFQRASRPPA
jgi:hypothetical protein